jgi:murein DD-endopeptidase MepM/ murein hydrolase activator NlpD
VTRKLALALLIAAATAGCGIPRWPVDARVTSDFGLRLRGSRPDLHRGVDLDVPTGTPVRAMAQARVRFAGVMRGFGNVIWLDHGGAILTVYAHLSDIRVREGETVRGGQVIGLSGATGDVTTPHLHFEVWRWGHEVDPIPLLGGRPRAR